MFLYKWDHCRSSGWCFRTIRMCYILNGRNNILFEELFLNIGTISLVLSCRQYLTLPRFSRTSAQLISTNEHKIYPSAKSFIFPMTCSSFLSTPTFSRPICTMICIHSSLWLRYSEAVISIGSGSTLVVLPRALLKRQSSSAKINYKYEKIVYNCQRKM